MTRYLLDVNVVIAILDPLHTLYDRAWRWFETGGSDDWLTCPTVENGVIRVMSGPAYSNVNASPERIMRSLQSLRLYGGHAFAPDSISLLDEGIILTECLLATRQVTDTYLLALAVRNDVLLATLDTRLATTAVRSGAEHLHQIP